MFQIVPENFFVPLSSPNKLVYWECICKLFSVMEHQLSFGVEREVLADELQFYFEQENAAELIDEEFQAADSRGRANGILRRLEYYGWIEIETDKSYVQRVNFKEYAVQILENTDLLITGLKNLNSSIKHYIDGLPKQIWRRGRTRGYSAYRHSIRLRRQPVC